MDVRLFEHQRALDVAHLARYAADPGLDVARFNDEMADGRHRGRVREDFLSGERSEGNDTPTFFINGVNGVNGVRHDDSYAPLVVPVTIRARGGGRVGVGAAQVAS